MLELASSGVGIEHCLVYDHPRPDCTDCKMQEGRDEVWSFAVPQQSAECECEWVDAEDPSFMLYTSGST